MSSDNPQNAYSGTPQPLSPNDEKLYATLTHVGGIFFSVIPALIVFLVFKDRGPFIRAHSLTALNFQLTMLIAAAIGTMLTIVGIGFLVLGAVSIAILVFSIIAAVAANNGQFYSYPLTIPFVK
ncbi:MAG: DUF4870 domain-containing protein [Microbacteriaceae bacterium]|nr:DUF4870 domain-containing protein [Microbacteriaceae bacterium]